MVRIERRSQHSILSICAGPRMTAPGCTHR
jgi:hypothetical protein